MKYLSPEDCEVDILRSPFNRSNKYSLIMLIGGHSQSGKTTLVWYLANRIMQLRKYGYKALDPFASCNTWREWDGRKFSATTPQEFVKIWNNNEDAVLTLSEASTTLYYMDWMSVMSRVFNSTTTVLGKQHNICFLDTVMESELMQKARDKIDYRIELHRRNDFNKTANVRSGWTLIDYLGMKWMLIRNNEWNCHYSHKMLLMAKQYTDWIAETCKQREAEENERRVGLRPYQRSFNPSKPVSMKNIPEDVAEELM
jgi:hypothetical protein